MNHSQVISSLKIFLNYFFVVLIDSQKFLKKILGSVDIEGYKTGSMLKYGK